MVFYQSKTYAWQSLDMSLNTFGYRIKIICK